MDLVFPFRFHVGFKIGEVIKGGENVSPLFGGVELIVFSIPHGECGGMLAEVQDKLNG